MEDGFVKEPAVVTRKDFNPAGIPPAEIERIKLEDGIRLHENVKVELDTYARESGRPLVKPFVLVIARDTTHAAELDALMARARVFGAELLPALRRGTEVTATGFARDQAEYRDAQMRRLDAELEYTRLRVDLARVHTELLYIAGEQQP